MEDVNKHGVKVFHTTTGHYGHFLPDGRFESGLPVEVPVYCVSCRHYDGGEHDDMGYRYSPPSCVAGCWFPTRTGKCARHTGAEVNP